MHIIVIKPKNHYENGDYFFLFRAYESPSCFSTIYSDGGNFSDFVLFVFFPGEPHLSKILLRAPLLYELTPMGKEVKMEIVKVISPELKLFNLLLI